MTTFIDDLLGGAIFVFKQQFKSSIHANALLAAVRDLDAAESKAALRFAGWSQTYWEMFVGYAEQTSVVAQGFVASTAKLPVGTSITSATAYVYPGTGRAGMPGTKPILGLLLKDRVTGAQVSLTTVNEPATSTAVYETYHTITVTPGSPVVVGADDEVWVYLAGETGANSQTGLRCLSLDLTFT